MTRRNFPLSLYLGTVGMPGVTAWIGLNKIGQPKAGETVVVSAASGAVGSVVGQLAKMQGCRVVGIAGGALKCAYTMEDLGFDGCVDYKAGHIAHDLERETPDGIDIYFENVGGDVSGRGHPAPQFRSRASRSAASSPTTTRRRRRASPTCGSSCSSA